MIRVTAHRSPGPAWSAVHVPESHTFTLRRERRFELRDLADPVAGDANREDPCDVQAAGRWVADVLAERRLTIRPDWHQAGDSPPVGVDGGEEPVHRLGAAVFGTAGAHQHPRVVGRQGGERIEVPLGEGMDEAADQCALIWSAGWRLQTGGRAGRIRGAAGASECAGDGVLGLPEQLGGLARAASEHVTQHEMAKRYGCSNRSDDATATRPHLAAASASVDDSLE